MLKRTLLIIVLLIALIFCIPLLHGNYIFKKYNIKFDQDKHYNEEIYDIFWIVATSSLKDKVASQIPIILLSKEILLMSNGLYNDSSIYNESGILFSVSDEIIENKLNKYKLTNTLSLMYWISITQDRNSVINYVFKNWMNISSNKELNSISILKYDRDINEIENDKIFEIICEIYYGKKYNQLSIVEERRRIVNLYSIK